LQRKVDQNEIAVHYCLVVVRFALFLRPS